MQPFRQSPVSIYLKSQFCARPVWPSRETLTTGDLAGQTALVTGGNTGLGYHACRQLLALGLGRLVVAVRSLDRGEAAAAALRREFPRAVVLVWELDLSSYDSVARFARRAAGPELAVAVGGGKGGLDVAVLNAGIVGATFRKNPNTGHEEVIQVNYLSTFLLAILLLPVLNKKKKKSSSSPQEQQQQRPGRLTIVNSGVAYYAKLPNRARTPFLASFDSAEAEASWDPSEWYSASKVLGHLFFARLAARVDPDAVVVNLVDPGFCKGTELHRDARGLVAALLRVAKVLTGRSLEVGASTYVDAAVVKGEETHGCFVMDWKVRP